DGGARGTKIQHSPCAGKTGRWLQMRVLYVEGLASRDGSESCAGIREDVGEALTGVHVGRVSSREKLFIRGADAVEKSGRQHGMVRYGEHGVGPARSITGSVLPDRHYSAAVTRPPSRILRVKTLVR